MANGKNKADWNQTSHIMATLCNLNRQKKSDPIVQPSQLNPYAEKRKEKPAYNISIATIAKGFVQAQQ